MSNPVKTVQMAQDQYQYCGLSYQKQMWLLELTSFSKLKTLENWELLSKMKKKKPQKQQQQKNMRNRLRAHNTMKQNLSENFQIVSRCLDIKKELRDFS